MLGDGLGCRVEPASVWRQFLDGAGGKPFDPVGWGFAEGLEQLLGYQDRNVVGHETEECRCLVSVQPGRQAGEVENNTLVSECLICWCEHRQGVWRGGIPSEQVRTEIVNKFFVGVSMDGTPGHV